MTDLERTVGELEKELDAVRDELLQAIADSRKEMRADMEAMRIEMRQGFKDTRDALLTLSEATLEITQSPGLLMHDDKRRAVKRELGELMDHLRS